MLSPDFDDSLFNPPEANAQNQELTAQELKRHIEQLKSQQVQSVPLSDIEAKEIKWLHPGRIPLGKITVIAGNPGVGKTFLVLDIAARVSTGNTWPDGAKNEAGNVIILTAEDDLADTIKPRLITAGANHKRIYALQMVEKIDQETAESYKALLSLSEDLTILEEEIKERQPKLIIIDPLNAYLPNVDTHRDADLRSKVFGPLKELAEAYEVAIICVMHLNKSNTQNAIHRVSGSTANVAASRGSWLVTNDNDEESRKLMLPLKFNLGPKPDGLAYKIIQNENFEPVIAWEDEPVDINANEALQSETISKLEKERAEEFLKKS